MDFRVSKLRAYIFPIKLPNILIYNVLKCIGHSIYLLQHYACHANRITDIETGIGKVKLVYMTRKYEVRNQYKTSYLLKRLIVLNFKTGLVHRFLPLIDYTLFTLDILRH